MPDFIKKSALKNYISSIEKARINKTAFNNMVKQINSLTQTVIKQSNALAKQDKRTTIMPRDIAETIDETLGKQLGWEELSKQITKLGPIELGNISKAIDQYIEKQKT